MPTFYVRQLKKSSVITLALVSIFAAVATHAAQAQSAAVVIFAAPAPQARTQSVEEPGTAVLPAPGTRVRITGVSESDSLYRWKELFIGQVATVEESHNRQGKYWSGYLRFDQPVAEGIDPSVPFEAIEIEELK
jgi:hypothetical protein